MYLRRGSEPNKTRKNVEKIICSAVIEKRGPDLARSASCYGLRKDALHCVENGA